MPRKSTIRRPVTPEQAGSAQARADPVQPRAGEQLTVDPNQPPKISPNAQQNRDGSRGFFYGSPKSNLNIAPTGADYQFSYRPSLDPSQLSPPSSEASESLGNSSDDDTSDRAPEPSSGESDAAPRPQSRPATTASVTADFTIEEIDPMDSDYDGLEVLRPTEIESNPSRSSSPSREIDEAMINDLRNLNCAEESLDDENGSDSSHYFSKELFPRRRELLRKLHKVSIGDLKRTAIQREDSGDDAEAMDADNVGYSARRLRRSLHRPSLEFKDPLPPYDDISASEGVVKKRFKNRIPFRKAKQPQGSVYTDYRSEGTSRASPSIHVEKFLANEAVQTVMTHLDFSVLPDQLRQVMQLASWDSIQFSTKINLSTSDKIKSFVEDQTGSSWNWWPLEPPKRAIQDGHLRMDWQCHCGKHFSNDVTSAESLLIDKISRCLNRAITMPGVITHTRHDSLQKLANWFKRSSETVLPVSVPPSQQPQGQSQSPPAPTNTSDAQQPSVTGITTHNSTESLEKDALRILFGVPMGRKMHYIVPVPASQGSGAKVFPSLQREYTRSRGRWKALLSFWQFSHCNFVKFEAFARKRAVACGNDLPTANNTDYDYTPKPPQASMPPIHPHIFEVAFNSCGDGKCSKVLPFHDCYEFDETSYVTRIPKKKTPFGFEAGQPIVWGLEARHSISALHVVLYHLLILIPPFVVWAWWQRNHPDDIQSASVPMTVVIASISMFWSATGIIKQFRGES
ncbi:small s [Fusarium albosuccineum]|uniref:Small s n=1 Tax=Fusarium albosuccineum TaxID=1237068 RepID=A0A8H4LK18_9HYPO|nr:small s [Fusarium albosuccineum]